MQAFAAGYLEGHTSSEVLFMHWQNTVEHYCDDKKDICAQVRKFVDKNTKWAKRMIAKHKQHSPYWHQIGLFYDQHAGLVHGYNAASTTGNTIPRGDLFWLNIFGDLLDLEQVFAYRLNKTDHGFHAGGFTSCSALIKPVGGELYAAHDAWYYFNSMLRVLKKYTFCYHRTEGSEHLVPGYSMSFSSYPGVLFSGDDFNTISSGLVTIETSLANYNTDLYPLVKPRGVVLEGIRATTANRLARSGKEWTNIFARRNSGTYNNQWMVLDYKLFKSGEKTLRPNLLWVLEQMPGQIHSEDLTSVLQDQGYWPSYNCPYFKDIFDLTGAPAKVAEFGDYFTYESSPRALIFKRDHAKVKDVASMTKLMRYNDYLHDPLSRCEACTPKQNAEFAISARNDLNPPNGTYPFKGIGYGNLGGTDMKLTSVEMFRKRQFLAIGGPTYDNVPPFQWSKFHYPNITHYGHPDLWKFGPVLHQWTLP